MPVPKPVCFFFSGVQKEGYRYFLSCKVAFLFVFLGTVPKGLAAFFLPAITTLQVACGTPSTNVAVAASYRLNYFVLVLLFCFADKKMTLKHLVPNTRLKFCCLSVCCRLWVNISGQLGRRLCGSDSGQGYHFTSK